MTDRHDVGRTLTRMRQGTDHLLRHAAALGDDLRSPSGLPGWTRAHLIGHIARNAEALTRLATWARTGVENPMYATPQARATEIEQSAAFPPEVLHADLVKTAQDLDTALAGLADEHWQATVRSALGRSVPAAEIPWMRIREVWLHAVDLDNGATVEDIPGDVLDLLLDDVVAMLSGKDGCPAVDLHLSDRDRIVRLGLPDVRSSSVEGSAAEIVGWLTGRVDRDVSPSLPPWL